MAKSDHPSVRMHAKMCGKIREGGLSELAGPKGTRAEAPDAREHKWAVDTLISVIESTQARLYAVVPLRGTVSTNLTELPCGASS